jgi:hypothetical protein
MSGPPPLRTVIAFAPVDRAHRDALQPYLDSLESEGLIAAAEDRRTDSPGSEAAEDPDAADDVELLVLLVSDGLMGSGYLGGSEALTALLHHATGTAVVAPLILEECDWRSTLLGKVAALPTQGVLPAAESDAEAAWEEVVRGLRHRIEALHNEARNRSSAAYLRVETMGSFSVEVDLVRTVLRQMQEQSMLGPAYRGDLATPSPPAELGPDPEELMSTETFALDPSSPDLDLGGAPADAAVPGFPEGTLGVLEFADGPHKGTLEPLDLAQVSLGRHASNHIALDDPSASANHAMLLRDPSGAWTIVDLGSTNGTLLNGNPVHEVSLVSGDQILIGGSLIRLWFPDPG